EVQGVRAFGGGRAPHHHDDRFAAVFRAKPEVRYTRARRAL
ncbi:MAG: hypothetical protein AVDCRST_MAG02-54, partial [uncultured Rubrobacteraceae bacterium]